jgi:hypothetical protein
MCPHRNKSIGIRSGDRGDHAIRHRRPNFLDMSHSATVGNLPHSALELLGLESQCLPHSSRHIFKQSWYNSLQKITISLISQPVRRQIRAHESVPYDSSPRGDAQADMIPAFEDRMRTIPCPEIAVMDAEHILARRTCFVSP